MLKNHRTRALFWAFIWTLSCKREPTIATNDGAVIALSRDIDAETIEITPSMSASAIAPSRTSERTRTLPTAGPPASSVPPSLARLGDLTEPPSKEEGPSVTFAPPRVMGGLLTDVEPALRRMRAGVRACYQRFLGEEDEPPETSELSLHVVVMQSGSVRRAQAKDVARLSPSAVDCIVRRAEVATFPPAVGEDAEIIVPIHLHP
jgi:hypothetical protein